MLTFQSNAISKCHTNTQGCKTIRVSWCKFNRIFLSYLVIKQKLCCNKQVIGKVFTKFIKELSSRIVFVTDHQVSFCYISSRPCHPLGRFQVQVTSIFYIQSMGRPQSLQSVHHSLTAVSERFITLWFILVHLYLTDFCQKLPNLSKLDVTLSADVCLSV